MMELTSCGRLACGRCEGGNPEKGDRVLELHRAAVTVVAISTREI
jgi:hypothetical protein